jgi:hypothetical protein
MLSCSEAGVTWISQGGAENVSLSGPGPPSTGDGEVGCDERLGGLLKHHRRVA